jgi:predicted phosphohydrolase
MIVQYASDLHLEFPENKHFLKTNPLKPIGDVLVLAGDIVPFAVMDKHNGFFGYISDNFEATYCIPGNHEYYYFDLAVNCRILNENIRTNVHLGNNLSMGQDSVRLVLVYEYQINNITFAQ